MHKINRRRFVFVSSRKEAVFLPANKIAARARYGGCDSLLRPDPLHQVELMFIIWSVRCIQLFGPRNYRPRRPHNAGARRVKGAICRWGKEILALGPKTSTGQVTHGVFCRGGAEFEVTPSWSALLLTHNDRTKNVFNIKHLSIDFCYFLKPFMKLSFCITLTIFCVQCNPTSDH